MNNQNESIEILIKRDEIEERIKEYNYNHFKKAHNSIAFKDRIYKKLKRNTIRDKILNRILQRDECDDERVYRFLKLLQRDDEREYCLQQREIYNYDWIKVVKNSKKNSAS